MKRDTTMRWISELIALTAILVVGIGASAQDVEGSRDHPLFNRLPDYRIDTYRESEFDAYDGFVAADGSYKTVEGRFYYINYYFIDGTTPLSDAAVIRNYRDAFVKIGGVVQYADASNVHMNLDKGGKTTWVRVQSWNGGQGVALYIVEEQAMQQHIVADAEALAKEIDLAGRVAVYGIHFDTGKAVVKDESGPALEEVSRLLQRDPDLVVFVVGHTDSVGNVDDNIDLSRRRAAAVVEVLVQEHGVDRSRLDPRGVGPLVPVATNRSGDGRAENRRVEVVER